MMTLQDATRPSLPHSSRLRTSPYLAACMWLSRICSPLRGQRVWRTRCRAAMATPCAWLPADAQMTPARLSSSLMWARKLKAPRTLKEKTCMRRQRVLRV